MTKIIKKSELTKFVVSKDELKNRPNLIKVSIEVCEPYNQPISNLKSE